MGTKYRKGICLYGRWGAEGGTVQTPRERTRVGGLRQPWHSPTEIEHGDSVPDLGRTGVLGRVFGQIRGGETKVDASL